MNVILLTPTLDPRNGGIARSTPYLARALAAADVPVVLVYPYSGGELTYTGGDPGLTLRPLQSGCGWSALCQAQGLPKLLDACLADSVHGSCVLHHAGVWTAFNHASASFAHRRRIPLVCSPRGMLDDWSLRHSRIKKRIAWRLYAHRDLKRVDLFHATSNMEADFIRKLGFKQPIAVIPNGVEFPSNQPSPQVSGLSPQSSVLRSALFLSRLNPKKGIPRLLEAWASIRPEGWRLDLAGPDERGYRAVLEKQVAALGLGDAVRFLGNVADADKWALYRAADLFVLPTETENFGIVVAEALACGTPVLTTQGAPWSGLVDEGCGWWVENTSEGIRDGLASALVTDPATLRAMGERGRAYVRKEYDWNPIGERMLAAYAWLLNGGIRPEFVWV